MYSELIATATFSRTDFSQKHQTRETGARSAPRQFLGGGGDGSAVADAAIRLRAYHNRIAYIQRKIDIGRVGRFDENRINGPKSHHWGEAVNRVWWCASK